MNSHYILYWIAKNRRTILSILLFCFIKAIIPLFSYDGEPSVSKGIMSQLPSSHLFIHWVPAKLSNKVMPYGKNYCQLQLLFVFVCTSFYWPNGYAGIWYSVDALPCFSLLVFIFINMFSFLFSYFWVLFQNPARLQNHLYPSKALELLLYLSNWVIVRILSLDQLFLYLPVVSSGHSSFLFSVWYKSHVIFYML